MAKFRYFKHFSTSSLADGSTWSDSWVADEDLIIKRIHLQRGDGSGFTKSTFYFKIAGRVYTREEVPASVLGPDCEVSPVLDIPFKKGEKLDFVFENNEGTAIDVLLTFECWVEE